MFLTNQKNHNKYKQKIGKDINRQDRIITRMSLWIAQAGTKNEIKKKQSIKDWYKTFVTQILQNLKVRCTQSTYIRSFQNNLIDNNGHLSTISIESIYRSLFKINMTFEIIFNLQIKIKVKYHITALNFNIDQKISILQEFQYKIHEILYLLPYKSTKSFQNGITIQLHIFHSYSPQRITSYSEHTTRFVDQAYMLCEAMILDLQRDFYHSILLNENQNLNDHFDTYKGLSMAEKQNNIFKDYYKKQNKGISFLANPQNIQEKPHQILRQININVIQSRKQKKPSQNDQRYRGAFSKIFILEVYGEIIDTFFHHRPNHQNQEQDCAYLPGKKQGGFKLVAKQPSANDDAIKSMKNQKNYLLKIGGNSKNPYICNYFLPLKKPSQLKEKKRKEQKSPQDDELYSQFHEDRVFERFYQRPNFTLLDVINFGQQVMLGLIGFYLNRGYLNRDIKEENILINKNKVIQIIDHGSIFLFKTKTKSLNNNEEKQLFDHKLRSTLYYGSSKYKEDPYIQGKYKNYLTYRDLNSTHRTFDVYSVGKMLEEILQTYELQKKPKWMEVCQRLKILIQKMTISDFQFRIQMEDALEELRSIRKFIFGSQL